MIRLLRAFYVSHATIVAYMLQSTEYNIGAYLKWYWRTQDFSSVMHRRRFDATKRARLLRLGLRIGMGLQLLIGLALVVYGVLKPDMRMWVYFGAAICISYPVVWAHLIAVPIVLANLFIVRPSNKRKIDSARTIFAGHPGVKIAVAGSYGKTSMKEMLYTVLSQGKKTAMTPANKNVLISQAAFARSLSGDEEVLIVEFGEGAPGDVVQMTELVQPNYAVITGLAPAHLDKYKTLQAAGQDIFSVAAPMPADRVLVNGDSVETKPFVQEGYAVYTSKGLNRWKVSDVAVTLSGTAFTLSNGSKKLHLKSGLVGRHHVGPLAAVAALAVELGLTEKQVEAGIALTKPFEHRMQPYQLAGAWVLDDTYNGNIEGIRAGTALLKELDGTRKWYVTPGLVDQGREANAIHETMGSLIAEAKPDYVVLMRNSATPSIEKGLRDAKFGGEVRVMDDPLAFYTNLDQFLSAGDLVLMQNDWTDNYA